MYHRHCIYCAYIIYCHEHVMLGIKFKLKYVYSIIYNKIVKHGFVQNNCRFIIKQTKKKCVIYLCNNCRLLKYR